MTPDPYSGNVGTTERYVRGSVKSALEMAKAAPSAFNKGLFSLPRQFGGTRALGKILYPDLPPEKAQMMVELRNVEDEKKAPFTSAVFSGLGTMPYNALIPGSGVATQGALSGALLSEAPDLYGKARDMAEGAFFGKFMEGAPRALGWAEGKLTDAASRSSLKATGAGEAENAILREKFGTPYGDVGLDAGRIVDSLAVPEAPKPKATGNVLSRWWNSIQNPAPRGPKGTTLPDAKRPMVGPTDDATDILANAGKIDSHYTPILREITDAVDLKRSNAIDLDSLFGRVEKAVEAADTSPSRAFGGGAAGVDARRLLQEFRDEATRARPTSTNVRFGEGETGSLGLPVEGPITAGPGVTQPAPRQVATELVQQEGLPLTRTQLQAGPETVPPRSQYTPYEPAEYGTNWSGNKAKPVEAPPQPPEAIGQTVGVQRDMFGTPEARLVEGNPIYQQDPPTAQGLARQQQMSPGPSVPEIPGPSPTTVNFDPARMSLSEALNFKRWLQREVNLTGSQRNPFKPEAAIAMSPDLQLRQRIAGILKDEAESAVQTHAPELYAPFLEANNQLHSLLTVLPTLQRGQNRMSAAGEGFKASRYAGRSLAGGVGGAGFGFAAGHPIAGALAGAGIMGIEGLQFLGGKYGHQLAAATERNMAAKAGALKLAMSNPTQPWEQLTLNPEAGALPKGISAVMASLLAEKEK
jgi:hypothetical protein